MDINNLYKDLGHVIRGIWLHEFLFNLVPPEGAVVLEPGCGSGKMGIHYALKGASVYMVDFDPSMLEYARRLREAAQILAGRHLHVTIRHATIHKLSYADGNFDLVYNEGVPHHWPDEERRQGSINEMARVSRGWVCVIGSNALCAATLIMAKETDHSYEGMPPKQKPFTPTELGERLSRAGLVLVDVVPANGPSWEQSPLLVGWGRKP